MLTSVFLLLLAAGLIYLSCEYFVNAVEWVGVRLGVSQNAVGTVLAAFGTALPESVVTFIAVAFGRDAQSREIGVGAALGGPLVLATIAYAVIGIVHWMSFKKRPYVPVQRHTAVRLCHDQAWFMAIFTCKVGVGLVAFAWKPMLGTLFLAAYAIYVWREMRRADDDGDVNDPDGLALEPLRFQPRAANPSTPWVLLQTTVALVVIFASSQLFVHQLDSLGRLWQLSPQLVALLLSPIATELPEILNAVIWVRQGKYKLALGNISGAMMIQATIPSALGMFYTPWMLRPALIWAAAVTMLSIAAVYLLFGRRAARADDAEGIPATAIAALSLFYLLFAAGLFWLPG
jgi:cation:H+ antiporter